MITELSEDKKEILFDAIEAVLEEYKENKKCTAKDIEENVEVSVFPVKDTMFFALILYGGLPIASVMDFSDHMVVSYYGDFTDAKSNDNLH